MVWALFLILDRRPPARMSCKKTRRRMLAAHSFDVEVPGWSLQTPHLWSRKLLHPTAGQGCFLARFGFARKGFSSLLQAVTSAVEFKRVAMVHESVENGAAHGVITEVGAPVLDNAVGRDHGAAA